MSAVRRDTSKYRRAKFERNNLEKFNLSTEDYAWILLSQEFKCGACMEDLDFDTKQAVHVDHCHSTGVIRGILCAGCNLALGHLNDNPVRIRRLADYVIKGLEG